MADQILKVGKQTYKLAFDFNAIARVQEETGINLLDSQEFSPIRLRANLWAALLAHHPGVTVEEAGRLITPRTLPHVASALNQIWLETEGDGTE